MIREAVAIPHYAVVANVIQTVFHYRVTDPSSREVLFAPGDVALGGQYVQLDLSVCHH
jgi:hypothetical protein